MTILPCPFPVRYHPEQRHLREATVRWLPNLPEGPALIPHRYDQVHAAMWPDAPWERLWLANRLLLHMWWIDDILDDPSRKDAEAIARSHQKVLVSEDHGRADGSTVLGELLAETTHLMPPEWLQRLRRLYGSYLTTSVAHRSQFDAVPPLSTYLKLRPSMGGMFYATTLIELAYDCPLPSAYLQTCDPTVRVNHICCWANDLHAYAREISRGDSFNLVAILTTHHGMTLKRAIRTVEELINAEITVLDFLTAPTTNEYQSRYLRGLRDMVAAILTWSANTERYTLLKD